MNREMVLGGLFCTIGIQYTLWSYDVAVRTESGTFTFAWGAILFGAIPLLRGVLKRVRGE